MAASQARPAWFLRAIVSPLLLGASNILSPVISPGFVDDPWPRGGLQSRNPPRHVFQASGTLAFSGFDWIFIWDIANFDSRISTYMDSGSRI